MKRLALFIVAVIFGLFSIPLMIIYTALDSILDVFYTLAIVIDMGGNVAGANLFNDILIVKDGYQFGNRKETISSVLGKNKHDNTLKPLGRWLANTLDFIDENHCLRSIDNNV